MKIKNASAGVLTNFEVLDLLRSRGASKDPTRVMASLAPSEFKVFDYLVETAACNQSKENISELLEKCKTYDLAKAEIVNIINIRPTSAVELDPMIEQSETRLGERLEDLAELVTQVLPPPPNQSNPEDGAEEDNSTEADDQATGNNTGGEQMDAS
ncbi:hypothetical protein Ancab_031784 [Ancistrocladus abbreviatus]